MNYLKVYLILATSLWGLVALPTAIRGKFTILGILPLVLVLFQSVNGMSRASILIAAVLFIASFLFFPHSSSLAKMFVTLFLVGLVIGGGLVFISSKRGLVTRFKYEAPAMGTLRKYISFAPSWYSYLSAPSVVFSEYLKAGGERLFPGQNTFAPFFNILSHFGLVKHSAYLKFYYTPIASNSGTYLRDLHEEFGYWGILFFPYLLGVICTLLYVKIKKRPNLVYIALLTHLYVIVVVSFDVNAMKLGYWWISMIAAVIGGYLVECFSKNRFIKVQVRDREKRYGKS